MPTMNRPEPGPPAALVRALVGGPSPVRGLEWHDEVASTNTLAAQAAVAGVDEIHVVGAEAQTAGRGRLGRAWHAPVGTSLTFSLVLRPGVPAERLLLLPLLTGLAVAETLVPWCPGVDVAVKWPNDLQLGGRKAAGILAEQSGGAVVVGIGLNVDWRGVDRPAELSQATSIAEAVGGDIDRWRVLAALLGVFGNRYEEWRRDPGAFLERFRAHCATIGQQVRITRTGGAPLEGQAVAVADDGALLVRTDSGGVQRVAAGDVEHLRPIPDGHHPRSVAPRGE